MKASWRKACVSLIGALIVTGIGVTAWAALSGVDVSPAPPFLLGYEYMFIAQDDDGWPVDTYNWQGTCNPDGTPTDLGTQWTQGYIMGTLGSFKVQCTATYAPFSGNPNPPPPNTIPYSVTVAPPDSIDYEGDEFFGTIGARTEITFSVKVDGQPIGGTVNATARERFNDENLWNGPDDNFYFDSGDGRIHDWKGTNIDPSMFGDGALLQTIKQQVGLTITDCTSAIPLTYTSKWFWVQFWKVDNETFKVTLSPAEQ